MSNDQTSSGDKVGIPPEVADRVDDILAAWEEGDQSQSAAELCKNSPDLLPFVREAIRRLQNFGHVFGQQADAIQSSHVTRSEPPTIPGFRPIRPLGEGGVGIVWEAIQISTNRRVAIKYLKPLGHLSPRAGACFTREIELAAKLHHPNIASIFESGLDRDVWFYALEYVDGLPLDQYVQQKKLDQAAILQLVMQICDALQYAHQRGVIHRDLKPSNILVSEDGHPHVLDFGLAKDVLEEQVTKVSTAGDIAGTLEYMAPEQAAGQIDTIGTRSDIYALGVVLYRLLTGRLPYESGSRMQLLGRIVEGSVLRPRQAAPAIHRDLEAVLLKALARLPNERYASMAEFRQDLAAFSHGEIVTAQPATLTRFVLRRAWKHRIASAAGALGALAFLIALIVIWLLRHDAIQQRNGAITFAENARRAELHAESARQETQQILNRTLVENEYDRMQRYNESGDIAGTRKARSRLLELLPQTDLSNLWALDLFGIAAPLNTLHEGFILPDGEHVVHGDGVWDIRTGLRKSTLRPPTIEEPSTETAYSPDGKSMLVGNHKLVLWDLVNGTVLHELSSKNPEPNDKKIICEAFFPDGKSVAAIRYKDDYLNIWSIATGELIQTLAAPHNRFATMVVSPNQRIVVCVGLQEKDAQFESSAPRVLMVESITARVAITFAGCHRTHELSKSD